jgi:hypothetical protein
MAQAAPPIMESPDMEGGRSFEDRLANKGTSNQLAWLKGIDWMPLIESCCLANLRQVSATRPVTAIPIAARCRGAP